MSKAQPEENKGRLKALEQAARILREQFDVGFVVVSHEEAGLTRFAKTEWGNRFAICKLSKDFSDGFLDPEEFLPEDTDFDDD